MADLAKKLQIKPGNRVVVVNEPEGFRELLGGITERSDAAYRTTNWDGYGCFVCPR